MSHGTPDHLDAGLAAGFGPRGGDSVLTILKALAGPEAALPEGEQDRRYEILGEIARGGVGIVIRGRDTDLGRDVAFKVIRPEYASNRDVVRRFVEEAQIGGQLQHPGIVPVYELGLHEDRRAYFTMKLIRGRTLGALLQDRAGPSAGRRRFLAIFEQVCQTVAYAHSRGVVHRDLKPTNVMVGAFGEVQVVDWGFAKVLAQGGVADERRPTAKDASVVRTVRTGSDMQSQTGSVMGTPSYMPPEQALGQVEDLDERADVFSLGAILCEILTGQPPYAAAAGDPLLQAARADLAPAHERLAACGADPALVDLARACLQGEIADRPRHAGHVADAVTRHLASVEERARTAELTAEEERVRVREETKRRRLAFGLAAAVLLTVVAAGGTYGWFANERIARRERNTLAVHDALANADQLAVEARGTGALETWRRAIVAAHAARDLAETVEIDDETARRTRALVLEVEEAARRKERDLDTVARLDEIHLRRGDTFRYREVDGDYTKVFADYGIDIDAETAVPHIRASAVRDRLCEALDEWATVIDKYGEDLSEKASRLHELVRAADADPWRTRLRAARDDVGALRALAREDPARLSPWSIVLLADRLAVTDDLVAAIRYLERAHAHHPGDFWINFRLGTWLANRQTGRPAAGAGYLRAALALRPASVEVRHQLGIALSEAGDHEEALRIWREALRLKGDFHHLHVHILESQRANGRLQDVLGVLERNAAARPEEMTLHYRRGIAFRILKKYGKAAAAFREALAIEPGHYEARLGLAHVLYGLGQYENARGEFARLTGQRPGDPWAWLYKGFTYGLQGQVPEAIACYERAVQAGPAEPRFRMQLAIARARIRDLDEARREYEQMKRRFPGNELLDVVGFRLAQAHERHGLMKETRALARDLIASQEARLAANPNDVSALVAIGSMYCDCLYEFDRAIATFEQALSHSPDMPQCTNNLAVAHEKKRDRTGAVKWYRKVVERWPRFERARVGLARWLVEDGKADEAIPLSRADADRFAIARLRLAFGLLRTGKTAEAAEHLGLWIKQRPGPPDPNYPADRWKADAATMVRLAERADAILAGEIEPGSARDALLFGFLCYEWSDTPAAARFLEAAFAADPGLADEFSPHRGWRWRGIYAHACIHAGFRVSIWGEALDDDAARGLRDRGRAALRHEVSYWTEQLGTDATRVKKALSQFRDWLTVSRFGDLLARVPAAERRAWAALWDEVGTALRRAWASR